MADRIRRRRAGAVAFVAGMGLLAGCATMPTSGPVIAGPKVQGGNPPVYVQVDPPTPGDDQLGIVDGFIDAMGSYEPNYETARQFLAPGSRDAWDPTAEATVYAGAKPTMQLLDSGNVELTHTVSGWLRADGSFAQAAPDQSETFEIQLEQIDGEWRIVDPPPGLLISDFNFSSEFRAYNVYFYDPGFSILVPDSVYAPIGSRSPATVLAQALLSGPTDWLAPAVATAFPDDVTLSVDAVPVQNGEATVELSDEAGNASPEAREQMAAQLAVTLGEVSGVERVRIMAGDTPLTAADTTSVSADDFDEVDPSAVPPDSPLYAVGADGVVQVEGDESTRVAGAAGSDPSIREVAVDGTGGSAAAVDGSGTSLSVVDLDGDEDPIPLLTGTDLRSPAWDRLGTVWVLDLDESGRRVPKAIVEGTDVTVSVAGLAQMGDGSVQALQPSPDGTRVALVIGEQAYVGLIIRNGGASNPVQITGLRRLRTPGEAVDVAWREADEVAVLTDSSGGSDDEPVGREVYGVNLDGTPPAPRGSVGDAVSIAAKPRNPMVVATADGTLLRQNSGSAWAKVGSELSSPAYGQG